MPDYKVRFLELAHHDLRGIVQYFLEYSQQAATDFMIVFEKRVLQLCLFPKMYETYPKKPKFRKMVVDRYLVFYEVDEENNVINVYRILHSARDIENLDIQGEE